MSLFLDTEKKLYTFGWNPYDSGYLNINVSTTEPHVCLVDEFSAPLKAITGTGSYTLAWDVDGNCYGNGHAAASDHPKPFRPSEWTRLAQFSHLDIMQVESGQDHSIMLTKEGEVVLFGVISHLKIENLSINTPVRLVGCGQNFAHLVDVNDRIYALGSNPSGQLGTGDLKDCPGPTVIDLKVRPQSIRGGSRFTLILEQSGKVYLSGESFMNTNQFKKMKKVPLMSGIIVGGDFGFLIDTSGKIWSFGYNTFGQQGPNRSVTSSREYLKPKVVRSFDQVQCISAGMSHTLVLDQQNRLLSFGNTNFGRCGIRDAQTHQVPLPPGVTPWVQPLWELGNFVYENKPHVKSARNTPSPSKG